MSEAAKPARKNRSGNWIFWWMVDPTELQEQLEHYDTLKINRSARGICLLLFVGSAILTVALTELINHDRLAYIDATCFLALGVFIFFRQRWAMLLGMALWTLEKVTQLVLMVQSGHYANPIGIVIFWSIFMHAMYLAFRVEQARRTSPQLNPSIFD